MNIYIIMNALNDDNDGNDDDSITHFNFFMLSAMFVRLQ